MDLYPTAKESTGLHDLIPGHTLGLYDPIDAFQKKTTVAYNGDKGEYQGNQHATINIATDDGFLDVDNSWIQCRIVQKIDTGTVTGPGNVLDQLASSIVRRILVKVGGQTLCDMEEFALYHYIHMMHQSEQNPEMAYFQQGASKISGLSNTSDQNPLSNDYGVNIAGAYKGSKRTDLLVERLHEDIKRALKINTLNDGGQCQVAENRRENTDDATYNVLLKLSDIPCFQSKMYFPLFAVSGGMQIQLDFETPALVGHKPYNGAAASDLQYSVYNLEAVCQILTPSDAYKKNFMKKIVEGSDISYVSSYAETSRIQWTSASAQLLFNVSLSRMKKARFVHRVLEDVTVTNYLKFSKFIYDTDQNNEIATKSYRGHKWCMPWGKKINQIEVRVNGITYPQSSSSAIVSQETMLNWTEDNDGVLLLKDKDRYFMDSQYLAFNFSKDQSAPLQDVSGLNTQQNNQVQLRLNMQDISLTSSEIVGFMEGCMVIRFQPNGSIQLFR